jgi:hypothetical protein
MLLVHFGGDYRGEVGIVDQGQRVFLAGAGDLAFDALPVLLPEDVGGALVAGVEVGAVLGADERLERVDAGEQADDVVLAASAKPRRSGRGGRRFALAGL